MVRLTVREGGRSATSAMNISKCENCDLFSLIFDSLTVKTRFISLWGVSFFLPFDPHCFSNVHPLWGRLVLFYKNIPLWKRGLFYFRNNHKLWEWPVLFEKYPPTMRWAAVRGGIGDSSSCMKIDFFFWKSVSEHIES